MFKQSFIGASLISFYAFSGIAMETPLLGTGKYFAIQSAANGKFVTTGEKHGQGALIARSDKVGDWEKFEISRTQNGQYSIKGLNGKFLQAKDGGDSVLAFASPHVAGWEQFDLAPQADGTYSIRASNGKFISAIDGGNKELRANSPHVSGWERFTLVKLSEPSAAIFSRPLTAFESNQRFAIRALATGKYVTVECHPRGSLPLKATADDYIKGGVFTLSYSPKTGAYYMRGENGLYLMAGKGGGGYINSVGSHQGKWEALSITQEKGGSYSVRVANGQYLSAKTTSDNFMHANADEIGEDELFEIIPL